MPDFNIARENELIAAGTHFWCWGHLGAVPIGEKSPDPRYCKFCFDFLNDEVKILKEARHFRKGAAWVPKASKGQSKKAPDDAQGGDKPSHGTSSHAQNMSTVNRAKNTVDIIKPPPPIRTVGKRGPKHIDLPEEMIKQLAHNGMGSKAIATRLRVQGIEVSYKTIQRFLSSDQAPEKVS
jgi:hypothetical protein